MLASHVAAGFHIGLLVTAFGFGFRHGIDWDHIAALTDITGAQVAASRSMFLATLYAAGHGLVVFALGIGAVVLSSTLPPTIDTAMEHVVGGTLIVFGGYVLVSLVRRGRDFRLQSRWMIVIDALRRLVSRRRDTVVIVDHDHEHATVEAHDHAHVHAPAGASSPSRHSHAHRHVGSMPADPFGAYGGAPVFAVGMLHGIGGETPTQVLIFAAAAGVGGRGAGVVLLVAFLAGLLVSNTAIALAGTFGFMHATRNWPVYATVSCVTAGLSLVVGGLFLFGHGALLPTIFSG